MFRDLWRTPLARASFDEALERKGSRVLPNLFFRRGKLALDAGELARAREEFERSYEESQLHTSQAVREELAVVSHHALGLTAWRERDYDTAMRWLQQADDEQRRYGGRWIPDIPQHIAKLRTLMNP